ncbi:MAG: radical SAM protein [Chloroflexi bacterium]|nr:radical SAM protein [Chloroflexota bacterium]
MTNAALERQAEKEETQERRNGTDSNSERRARTADLGFSDSQPSANTRLHDGIGTRVRRLKSGAKRRVTVFLLGQFLGWLGTNDQIYLWIARLIRRYANWPAQRMIADWIESYFAPGKAGSLLLKRLARETHPNQRRKFLANMIMSMIGHDMRVKHVAANGRKVHPPALVLLTPTQRCPLRCRGCYSGNYSRKDDLPTDIVWRTLSEARDLGTKFFVILGGEPLIWEDLFPTAAKFSDCAIQFYTSGHTLDREKAKKIVSLGNLLPCVSIEGFQEVTDWRRGKGGFDRAIAAMENLRAEKALFGYSVTVTHDNVQQVVSDEFADLMIEKGAGWGWYFLYMPVGMNPEPGLMPTPEDRNLLRQGIERIRNTKPLLSADFYNDGPLSEGCLAGGRRYLHINNYGDIEPCIFMHFATHNVKTSTLMDALASDFFQALQKGAPYGRNLLRPCPIIDHPKALRTLVRKFDAYPTHPGAESIICDPELTCHLDCYSKQLAEVMDPIFAKDYRWVATLHDDERYDLSKHPPKKQEEPELVVVKR